MILSFAYHRRFIIIIIDSNVFFFLKIVQIIEIQRVRISKPFAFAWLERSFFRARGGGDLKFVDDARKKHDDKTSTLNTVIHGFLVFTALS